MVWSVSPAWEAVELTLGDRLHLSVRGPQPYRFRSDNCGCPRTNAWLFSTFPQRRLLAFLVKLVPWELAAGPVPCSDRQRVSLEPAVQSRTEMIQKSALKIYLMPRNLGQPHTPGRRGGPGHLLEHSCL